MSQASAPANQTATHQRERAGSQAQQAPAGLETAAPVAWGGLARGGVSAPPLPPPGVFDVGAPRGFRRAGAGYVLELQRVHGNLQTARWIALARQDAAGSVEPAAKATDPGSGSILRFPAPAADRERAGRGTVPIGVARLAQPTTAGAAGGPLVQRGIWDTVTGAVGAVGNLAAQGASFLFEQALRLAGVPADLLAVLRRAGAAFEQIVADPMAFLSNLLGAVMGGFRQFAANIGTHIVNGLVGWLTGALGGAGLRLPQRFDLAGIFDLALQVLGLTADRIRQKIGRVIGAQNVARIEAVWTIVSNLIRNGLGGLWDMAREYLGNLTEMVLGPVKEWAITQVIQQGVLYVISLFNPAGAVVQAIRMIWNFIQFLRTRGQALLAVFTRVLESMAAIAAGNVGAAVNAVEQSLARAIPAVLDLLARLLGLGDVAAPIRRAIDAIRQPIDRALDRVIAAIARGVRGLATRGGAPGGRAGPAAQQEREQERQRRLQAGLRAGVAATNRFAGRPVGQPVLRPLLGAIRLRYRLAVLEPVARGDRWFVRGEVQRAEEPTEARPLTPQERQQVWRARNAARRVLARTNVLLRDNPQVRVNFSGRLRTLTAQLQQVAQQFGRNPTRLDAQQTFGRIEGDALDVERELRAAIAATPVPAAAAPRPDDGRQRRLDGQVTAPDLPERVIVDQGGVRIMHNYRSNDHAPAHLHVHGGGDTTRIGENGHPLVRGLDPELTAAQQAVVQANRALIRRACRKIREFLWYQQTTSPRRRGHNQ